MSNAPDAVTDFVYQRIAGISYVKSAARGFT